MLVHCPDHTHIPSQRSFHGLPLLHSYFTVLNGLKQPHPWVPRLDVDMLLYDVLPNTQRVPKVNKAQCPSLLHHLSTLQS